MHILIIDDDESIRTALEDELHETGNEISSADSGEAALALLKTHFFDLIISDVVMDKLTGMDILNYVKEHKMGTALILMTAYGTIEAAVAAVKAGALDYLCKPFDLGHLARYVGTLRETIRLRNENMEIRTYLTARQSFQSIIGASPAMQQLFSVLESVCDTDSTILIHGETGTGKEMIAEAIHSGSSRRARPFIPVSCAALSKQLLESELFGHEQGAFTGATKRKKGRFELANGGTIFLDEIDDIPLETQVKLLRVLQSGRFELVGGEETIQVNVRVLAATKWDLSELVEQEKFRKDLYYRLNVVPVRLPPLRERKEDIPLLVAHFFKKYSPSQPLDLSPEIMELLTTYDWDGNVRELEHTIERLVLLRKDGRIETNALPGTIRNYVSASTRYEWGAECLHEYLDKVEKDLLEKALQRTGNNKVQAASLLQIPLTTLKSKLAKFCLH